MACARCGRLGGVRRRVRAGRRPRLPARRGRAVPLTARTLTPGAIWGGAAFERIAAGASAAHDALAAALPLGPATRLLDVATGTGAVALRAAERGAAVTGVDIAPALLESARRAAVEAGLSISFRAGNAERLPFPRAEFDVVASAQGVVFAPGRDAAARELARVCRPEGTLGLTCPAARGFAFELARILAAFRPGCAWLAPFAWADRAELDRLLAGSFELTVAGIDAPFEAETPLDGWAVYSESFGPLVGVLRSLGPALRSELRRRVLELLGRYVDEAGVSAPRPLVLVVGRRRAE